MFFRFSPKRTAKLISVIAQSNSSTETKKLVDLCRTRWVARHSALVVFYSFRGAKLISSSVATTDKYNFLKTTDTSSKAASLLRSVTDFQFIVAFIIASTVLGY